MECMSAFHVFGITRSSRAFLGVVPLAAGDVPVYEKEIVMKTELKDVLRLITKVQSDPRVGPDQGVKLQQAKRELLIVARSGKLEKERLFRAVQIVVIVLQQIVDGELRR